MRIRPMENPSRQMVMRRARSVATEIRLNLEDLSQTEEELLTESFIGRVLEVEAEWRNIRQS